MKHFLKFPGLLLFSVALVTLSFSSCKKSNGNSPDPQNPYYRNDGSLSATVAGNNWQAKSVYAVDSSDMIVIVAGSNTTVNNYPLILLAFPDNTAEGATINFNIGQLSLLQFIEDASTVYWAEPAMGGSGTVTISKFNKSTKRVEGTFNAVLKNATPGSASRNLTGGQFAVNYR